MPSKYDYLFVKNHILSNGDQLLSQPYQYINAQCGLLILCGKCGKKYVYSYTQYKRSNEKGIKHQGCK